ncbi:MAG TPA: hypothetical protein VG939_19565, partial [Caulobacteraceae bacterium]|nr:hypothetical protein [Caulobacteraceae bacterium]
RAHPEIAEAALEWKPRLNWEWSAVVDVVARPRQEQPVDFAQAYVQYKPVPRSATRFSARAGLFYPPVSLEHDAPVWGLTNTITPSAINSWVGEEVKVLGGEASVEHDFGGRQVGLTGAVFAYDDTSGTLLTYRGWALHDIQSTARGAFDLPPLSAFAQGVQGDESYTSVEIDGRVGWYARLEWRPAGNLALNAFHYENRGDRTGVTSGPQWAWDTQFTDVGLDWKAGPHTRVLAQALFGHTSDGYPTAHGLFADVGFRAAYGLVSQDIGAGTLTGRLDLFAVTDHSLVVADNNDEHGWALTGAYRRPLGEHADLRFEALHVWSHRPSRTLAGLAPDQAQTVLQTSLRLKF